MESEKKKICPKCGCEDGSGQNNIHSMNPEHFCKCPIRSIMERDGVCYSCAFWIRLYEENKNNPNWLIIDGESWIANPFVPNTNNKTRRFMGMGGRMMEAISNDGRKIIFSDLSHSSFIDKLTYVSSKYGVTIHKIDKWYPSSKTCECGCINKGLSLRDRTWVCPACGAVNDRDILAARNILRKGISELESKSDSNDSNIGVSCVCIQESHLL